MTSNTQKRILWWGRHGNYGPNYPRNRTIIKCLKDLDHEVIEFQPRISKLANLEATLNAFKDIDLVWVPCFRQRDLAAAARWARKRNIPLVFDPLISAYDKRVNEKRKFSADSRRAKRLLKWEKKLYALADIVIADTRCHKQYFVDQLGCEEDKVLVIPVSAEEALFFPKTMPKNEIPEVLFFGTFIGLQGPTYIAESVTHYDGPKIKLTFLGDGPERAQCERIIQQTNNPKVEVTFEDWIPFHDLPDRIRQSDICLGVFGTGEKSLRVIPNKVYQALACGKPVVTMKGGAYPPALDSCNGVNFVTAGTPADIALSISNILKKDLPLLSEEAARMYSKYFSNQTISLTLRELLKGFKNTK
ncbi:glycosyltransferase [Alkalimarinus coralli]|uniref:glycosyltransferase n=1 Tax=Alkalimarinus coralli TaxID=2935863 RepID=UPI00202B4661|nr:glycosyltransferase [Alkalimarinus coralli]